MKLVVVIDGESAEELYAVGPNDLISYFLPNGLNVTKKDVVKIHFEEVEQDGKVTNSGTAALSGRPYKVITHPDNFKREAPNGSE